MHGLGLGWLYLGFFLIRLYLPLHARQTLLCGGSSLMVGGMGVIWWPFLLIKFMLSLGKKTFITLNYIIQYLKKLESYSVIIYRLHAAK